MRWCVFLQCVQIDGVVCVPAVCSNGGGGVCSVDVLNRKQCGVPIPSECVYSAELLCCQNPLLGDETHSE